jgi:hypothetical protein
VEQRIADFPGIAPLEEADRILSGLAGQFIVVACEQPHSCQRTGQR